MTGDSKKINRLFEDYATEPVPREKTVSGFRIGLVLGGIGIALPALLSGAKIGSALGLEKSIWAFLTTGAFLTVLGLISGLVGSRTRLSTYMIIRFSFGRLGSKLVNLSFALSQLGWFGVNAYLFGAAAQSAGAALLPGLFSADTYIVMGGALMTASTIFGFKALDKLALFAVPLLLLTLVLMVTQTLGLAPFGDLLARPGSGSMSFTKALSVLAGGIMVGVVLLPDLTRYSRSAVDTLIAILIPMAIVEPLVHFSAAVPSVATGLADALPILLAIGFGGWALFIVIFSSWTTNAVNLYGSGLALSAVFPRFGEWKIIALSGLAGTAIALFDIPDLFIGFLYYQALVFTPVVGIYVTDFFIIRHGHYDYRQCDAGPNISWPACAAWIIGSLIAWAGGEEWITITTVPALDAALAAAGLYWALMRLGPPAKDRYSPDRPDSAI